MSNPKERSAVVNKLLLAISHHRDCGPIVVGLARFTAGFHGAPAVARR